MSAELVGPLPTITFIGGVAPLDWAGQYRMAYQPPRNTCDPRVAACTDHHPACDCREGCFAEDIAEYRGRIEELQRVAWRALVGHLVVDPITPPGLITGPDAPELCLCSGCVIYREGHHELLPFRAIDWDTGRVRTCPSGGAS